MYFVDAATNFNILRYTTEMKLAGTALWRMGGEDLRLWDFYDKPMTKEALSHYDFGRFNKIQAGIAPDFEGEGEILDIVAAPKEGFIRHELDKDNYVVSMESPGEGWIQETDTFDTWFSSGQWPVVTLQTAKEGDLHG